MSVLVENKITDAQERLAERGEQMDIVVVGHVDHGKSTVIGRRMADTGSLPEGKLEQVRAMCERNARPFEYAFLLDALKNEQAQGITIDTARCFFKTAKRYYIIHDAPGHIEFLKNMVTGAARAEAALLVIDAHEGIQENSRRHGYILSMLGIRQVAVLVNKMDLVDYSQSVFDVIASEYGQFLERLGVRPERFIPISARDGVNLTGRSGEADWYDGPTVLEQVDAFRKTDTDYDRPFRMPVHDIYKFTAEGDDRRIVAGTIASGSIAVGDEVVFQPSGKRSTIASIEVFNSEPPERAHAGQAVGFTLTTQIYIKPGELMVRAGEAGAQVGTRLLVNLFWMGHAPMIKGKRYKMKFGSAHVPVELAAIDSVLDASELSSIAGKQQIDRHDVAVCLLETTRPVAFDLSAELEKSSRFVIIDQFEIAGCGIALESAAGRDSLLTQRVRQREQAWAKGYITPGERAAQYRQAGKFIILTGEMGAGTNELAKKLELKLFLRQAHTYYLSPANLFEELEAGEEARVMSREQQIEQLGELARIMTDAGLLFITALSGLDEVDLEKLRVLNQPNEVFVIQVGPSLMDGLEPQVSLPANPNVNEAMERIVKALDASGILMDYSI